MKKTLWIMCGAPASGKSYIAKNVLMRPSGWKYISRDEIRFSMLSDEDDYFVKEPHVYKRFVHEIKCAFDNTDIYDVIADATHLNWASRKKLLYALGQDKKKKDWNIIPVFITCDYETMKFRNKERSGRACVPEDVMINMVRKLSNPKNDPYEYTAIMEVRNS